MNYYIGYRRKRRQKVRFLTILLAVVIILLPIYLLIGKSTLINLKSPISTPTPSVKPTPQTKTELGDMVKKALEGTTGSYSIAIKNLDTKETYFQDEHKSYESASLYKLWVMATVYKEIQSESLKEDDVLSDTIPNLNNKFDIDPDLAELTTGSITMTVGNALTQMITISHNYAALLLVEKIGLSSVDSFLKSNGLSESSVGIGGGSPQTSASDIALFLEKLYKGDLANPEYTNQMIGLLKKQQLNDKIPKYLPQGTVIAHKTGELDYLSHDSGIVYGSKNNYIIVVMSESKSPAGAEDRIALVSKAVYQYFSK